MTALSEPTTAVDHPLEPLTADDCKHYKVEKGQKLVVTLKPTAPLGRFIHPGRYY